MHSQPLTLAGKEEVSYRQTTNTGLLSQRICAVPSAESWELTVSILKMNICKVRRDSNSFVPTQKNEDMTEQQWQERKVT